MEFWQLQKAFCNFSKWKTNEVRRKLNLTDADVKSLLRSIQALISHNNNRLKTLAGEIALINSNSIELQKTLSEVSNDHKHIIEFAKIVCDSVNQINSDEAKERIKNAN